MTDTPEQAKTWLMTRMLGEASAIESTLDEGGKDWLQRAAERMPPNFGLTREAYVALCREDEPSEMFD